MSADLGFLCRSCDERHDGLPMCFGQDAPDCWSDELADDPLSLLRGELCVIRNEGFFVRGLIEVPVLDGPENFGWVAWASVSREDFFRVVDLWTHPARERELPYAGWLATELPVYPESTINLMATLHTGPAGERPVIVTAPAEHPLSLEQRDGIVMERVQRIAELFMHAG